MSNDSVYIELTLPNELIYELMLMAHERDVTFNQFVNDILLDAIKKEEQLAQDLSRATG